MALEIGSDERGFIFTPFAGVAIGQCEAFDGGMMILEKPTADQEALFSNRLQVPVGDMVAFFVSNTIPPKGGCAASPIDKPSLIVTRASDEFTLAHEVGHVLGLKHAPADQPNRLMHPGGTPGGADLTPEEVETMKSSFRLL